MTKKSEPKIVDGIVIPKLKSGPPEWVPTEAQLYTIERCSSVGMKEATIAGVIGISGQTLNDAKLKYPRIADSILHSNGRLVENLTMRMLNYINDEDVPYPAKRKDIQYILSMKGGWRTQVSVVSESPSLPSGISFEEVTSIDPTND